LPFQYKKKTAYFNQGYPDERVYEKNDKAIQIVAKAVVQMRHSLMIEPFADHDAAIFKENFDKVPEFDYNVASSGFKQSIQNGVNNPGFWTCSRHGHTQLQWASMLNNRHPSDVSSDRENVLTAKALLHSFSSSMAEACHLGYGPFADPGEPLVAQTILSDGHTVKLAVFQLRKTALAMDQRPEEALNNVLWHSPEFDLMDGDEINLFALKEIIKLYMQPPTVQTTVRNT